MRLDEPHCISETIQCPMCGAPPGVSCDGIQVHPEYGPMAVHEDRLKQAVAAAEIARVEPPSETLDRAAHLGLFAFGVPCCAGQDGPRIRVVALEPVTPLDLGVARMKLERWHPEAAEAIGLAAAGCWAGPR